MSFAKADAKLGPYSRNTALRSAGLRPHHNRPTGSSHTQASGALYRAQPRQELERDSRNTLSRSATHSRRGARARPASDAARSPAPIG